MWSTRTRIRLLDDWGVDAAVVFPTIGILWDKEEDPELAMAYARAYNRCLRLGFKGVFVAPEPVCGKRPSHPDFDPLWRELQAADLPLCLHVIVRLNRTVGGVTQWFDRAKGESNTVFGFGPGGTYQLIPAISALVCDGLFDRFPRLKALVVETGAGWVGYIMDRLDEKYERFGALRGAAPRRPRRERPESLPARLRN